jgi:thiamine-phosphate pyrophosphorylase
MVTPTHIGTYRILDANLNRLREGLRVLEEQARFISDDKTLTVEIKSLRHLVKELIKKHLDQNQLIRVRDSTGDIGADLDPASEMERTSIIDIIRANFKRTQESSRILEEYAKLVDPVLAQGFKRLRFSLYTLEQKFEKAAKLDFKLYLLTSSPEGLKDAVSGGVDLVQFRLKDVDDQVLLEKAKEMAKLCKEIGVPLIINDRPDICLLVNADGVHLGQDDIPVNEARKILGPGRIIGRSTHNLKQALAADLEDVDYIAIGSVFHTESKGKSVESIGLNIAERVVKQVKKPVVAIGGINIDNLPGLLITGVKRVAVIRAILGSGEARENSSKLKVILNERNDFEQTDSKYSKRDYDVDE